MRSEHKVIVYIPQDNRQLPRFKQILVKRQNRNPRIVFQVQLPDNIGKKIGHWIDKWMQQLRALEYNNIYVTNKYISDII